jgi:hypothetical protein
MNLKNLERYLRVNLLGPGGPSSCEKEFTGPRSHKGWETLLYAIRFYHHHPPTTTINMNHDPKDLRYIAKPTSSQQQNALISLLPCVKPAVATLCISKP